MFICEISNPFINLRLCFDCMDDLSIGNLFRFLFGGGDVDNTECIKRGNMIRKINDIIFVVTFITARPLGIDILGYYIHTSQAPLHFKLTTMGLWFLSYIWIWEIINKVSKVLAMEVFPGNKVS